MIKSLIPSFFQINPSFVFPLVSLVVSFLSIFLLVDKTSSQPKPRSVSSLVIPDFNEGIVAILLIHIDTLSLPMSPFFENSSMLPSSSDVISLPHLYTVSDTSSIPPATPPQPLLVYTRRSRIDTRPPVGSSPMAPSSSTPVLPSPVDLPIAIRKGARSSRNPHMA